MGGNALKNCETGRLEAKDYHELCKKVVADIARLYPGSDPIVIPAYRNKESFGDMDVLITENSMQKFQPEPLAELWASKEWVYEKNANYVSIELNGFQIDIIWAPEEAKQFSLSYFSWNDLGNLMGRVAHKMGLKFGHAGLYSVLRDGTHHLDEVLVTQSPFQAIEWLGFDLPRFLQGFNNLEDIFEFVAANERFNPDIYLLDNVNAIARIRDKKRATYTSFLAWCEEYKKRNPERKYYTFPGKTTWTSKLRTDFPDFSYRLDQAHARVAWSNYKKARFNGEIVQSAVALEGKELGKFIKEFTEFRGGKYSKQFEEWIIDTTLEQKQYDLRHFFQIFSTFNLSLV